MTSELKKEKKEKDFQIKYLSRDFHYGGYIHLLYTGYIYKQKNPSSLSFFNVESFRKDKNDINKIIFKSGDLQMSPYADFPKNNRISMEWGRETIEMQENGSTKNLLQMTDIYYSVREHVISRFSHVTVSCLS